MEDIFNLPTKNVTSEIGPITTDNYHALASILAEHITDSFYSLFDGSIEDESVEIQTVTDLLEFIKQGPDLHILILLYKRLFSIRSYETSLAIANDTLEGYRNMAEVRGTWVPKIILP